MKNKGYTIYFGIRKPKESKEMKKFRKAINKQMDPKTHQM
jgi:hypothetical protein